jgi:hypothetical protein
MVCTGRKKTDNPRARIVDQSGVLLQKDLGTKTNEVASAITEFNPDETWKPVEQ